MTPTNANRESLHVLDRQRVASFVRETQQNLQMTGLIDTPKVAFPPELSASPLRRAIDFLLAQG